MGEVQALFPPGVAVLAHRFPMIEGVAPKLPRGAEIVGGRPGHDGGPPLCVKEEVVGMGPHVDRVRGHEEGEIADDTDPP